MKRQRKQVAAELQYHSVLASFQRRRLQRRNEAQAAAADSGADKLSFLSVVEIIFNKRTYCTFVEKAPQSAHICRCGGIGKLFRRGTTLPQRLPTDVVC